MIQQKMVSIALTALRSKYAKWAICGTIGFIAEHSAGKVYDKFVMPDTDVGDS